MLKPHEIHAMRSRLRFVHKAEKRKLHRKKKELERRGVILVATW